MTEVVEAVPSSLKRGDDALQDIESIRLPLTSNNGYHSSRTEIWDRSQLWESYDTSGLPELPSSMSLPRSKKVFDVILHTARAIREHGGQLEILLKVKQADTNPLFDFLFEDSQDHAFYCFVKTLTENDLWGAILKKPVPGVEAEADSLNSSGPEESKDALAWICEQYALSDSESEDSIVDGDRSSGMQSDPSAAEEGEDFSNSENPCSTDGVRRDGLVRTLADTETDAEKKRRRLARARELMLLWKSASANDAETETQSSGSNLLENKTVKRERSRSRSSSSTDSSNSYRGSSIRRRRRVSSASSSSSSSGSVTSKEGSTDRYREIRRRYSSYLSAYNHDNTDGVGRTSDMRNTVDRSRERAERSERRREKRSKRRNRSGEDSDFEPISMREVYEAAATTASLGLKRRGSDSSADTVDYRPADVHSRVKEMLSRLLHN